MYSTQPSVLLFAMLIVWTITALDRQRAARVQQRALSRLGWRPSEFAAAAHMDQAEVTRQLTGEHHGWTDAWIAAGDDAIVELGLALIEEGKAIPSQRELALTAVSSLRKPMATVADDSNEQQRSA